MKIGQKKDFTEKNSTQFISPGNNQSKYWKAYCKPINNRVRDIKYVE